MSKTIRNPIAVGMFKRYGKTTSVMHDRRQARGGAKNDMLDYMDELLDEKEDQEQIRRLADKPLAAE